MYNINAFFKLKLYEDKKTVKELSHALNFDSGYVSRILNNQTKIRERNLKKFCKIYNIKYERITIHSPKFYNLFISYLNTVYSIDNKRDLIYLKIIELNTYYQDTPYLINIYLTIFIQSIVTQNFNYQFNIILKKLNYIFNSLEEYEKKIFCTFYFGYLNSQRQLSNNFDLYFQASNIKYNDSQLDMMRYYYSFSLNWCREWSTTSFDDYHKCLLYLKETNNENRLFNLNFLFANYLIVNNNCYEALQIYKDLLEKVNKDNIAPLLNNIAWCYLLLKDYPQAIASYLQTLNFKSNNDIYFNLAWCFFSLKNNIEAKKYIQLGKNSKNKLDLYYILLNWLEAMINKKYSYKSYKLLKHILNTYNDTLTSSMRKFINVEIINYLYAHNQHKKALQLCAQLINEINIFNYIYIN